MWWLCRSASMAKAERRFLVRWVAVTVAGFLVSLLWIEVGERPDVNWLVGVVGGLSVSGAQWFVLRHHIASPWRWVWVSAIAWCLMGLTPIGAMGWIVPRTLNLFLRLFYGVIEGAKVGVALGLFQWWVLRESVFGGGRWVVASVVCWGVGLPIGWVLGGILRQLTGFFLGDVIGLTLTWAIVAGLTGVGLMQLFWTQVRIRE